MKTNEDNAGQGAISLGNLIKANVISDAIVTGFKAVGSAVKAVGSAMINLGKQAKYQTKILLIHKNILLNATIN